ncbi:hypothetical protein CLOLEP_02729 [[Clostridium] leptum DSM 753]|uniref:Uncharacterized protein n=1 Tax=[Clostridium] leptum DSM 753 TaxID=428125 RepID=A7VVW6_9FIRM|nr:hypothetical protein CLOLEP_02729 [[Clostridium] leptum DSM 753]
MTTAVNKLFQMFHYQARTFIRTANGHGRTAERPAFSPACTLFLTYMLLYGKSRFLPISKGNLYTKSIFYLSKYK